MTNNLGLTIKRQLIDEDRYPIKASYEMEPEYVTIHNTANNASADGEIAYMVSNDQYVSYHWAVDDVEAIQAIPHDRNAWHCGDGEDGVGNLKSIGIEICHSLDPENPHYPQSEENGARLAAVVLHEAGLGLDAIRKHEDWSGKYCPHRILDNGDWENFKERIAKYYNEIKDGGESTTEEDKPVTEKIKNDSVASKELYGAGTVVVSKLNVREQPKTNENNIVASYEEGDTIYFDSYVVANGYHWISYIGGSGNRRYVASGTANADGSSNKEYINF